MLFSRTARRVSFFAQRRDFQHGASLFSAEGEFTGVGLFAAVSYDEGKTWPDRRLITPGNSAKADTNGYLALIQARDGRLHLLTSSKHYTFNLGACRTYVCVLKSTLQNARYRVFIQI